MKTYNENMKFNIKRYNNVRYNICEVSQHIAFHCKVLTQRIVLKVL